MVVRWNFSDTATGDALTFEINPNDGGTLQYDKQVNYSNTSAPDGTTVIFEGRDQPKTLEFSGDILTETALDDFTTWFDKRRQILLTDDLGRQFWIYITSFEPKRVRNASNQWKHTYTIKATVLDWE